MKSIFLIFQRPFKEWYQPDPVTKGRLESLAVSDKNEISCEEVFAVLDQFADAVCRGENPLLLMPLVQQHLDVCPGCREEYETLLSMLQPKLE